MRPRRIRTKPRSVAIRPHRVLLPPEQDEYWTYIAGAMALAPDAYHYMDNPNFGDHAHYIPAPGANGGYLISPYDYTHHTLARQSLSTEARYVLDLILSAPIEVLQLISTPLGRNITLSRISLYLRKGMGWETERISQTLDELHTYVADL